MRVPPKNFVRLHRRRSKGLRYWHFAASIDTFVFFVVSNGAVCGVNLRNLAVNQSSGYCEKCGIAGVLLRTTADYSALC